jgi:hypothetical protein
VSEPLGLPPLLTTNKDRLVVLAFPGGLVAMYRSELPVFGPPNFASKWLGTPIFVAIVLVVATWQILLRRPAQASTFSAEGLGKWTENDLRDFVKRHVNGQGSGVLGPGLEQGLLEKGPGLEKSLASWRGSQSSSREASSREASTERLRSRNLGEDRLGDEKEGRGRRPSLELVGVNGRSADVSGVNGRYGEKENHWGRPPIRHGQVGKDDSGMGRNVLGNLHLGASGVDRCRRVATGGDRRVELVRSKSLQSPSRERVGETSLFRSASMQSTGEAQQAAGISNDLDAFLKDAGFGDLVSPRSVSLSRSTSLNSDASAHFGANTASAPEQASQPRSGVGVNTSQSLGGGNGHTRLVGGLRAGFEKASGSIPIPHFVAEDFNGGTGAPEGVLGRGGGFGGLGRGQGPVRKLQGAASAEARDIDRILMGINLDELQADQPKSW